MTIVCFCLQDGNRIEAIAENITKTLDELLQKLTPENIKCVCQTLKVCSEFGAIPYLYYFCITANALLIILLSCADTSWNSIAPTR